MSKFSQNSIDLQKKNCIYNKKKYFLFAKNCHKATQFSKSIIFFKMLVELLQYFWQKQWNFCKTWKMFKTCPEICFFIFCSTWMMAMKYLWKHVLILDNVLLRCSWMTWKFSMKKPCLIAKCYWKSSISFEQLIRKVNVCLI